MGTVDRRLRSVFGPEERGRSETKRWGIGRGRLGLAPREMLGAGEHGARRRRCGVDQVMDRVDGRLQGEDAQRQGEAERECAAAGALYLPISKGGPAQQGKSRRDQDSDGNTRLLRREVADCGRLWRGRLDERNRCHVQGIRHDRRGPDRDEQEDQRGESYRAPVTSSHGGLRLTLRVGPGVVKAGPTSQRAPRALNPGRPREVPARARNCEGPAGRTTTAGERLDLRRRCGRARWSGSS